MLNSISCSVQARKQWNCPSAPGFLWVLQQFLKQFPTQGCSVCLHFGAHPSTPRAWSCQAQVPLTWGDRGHLLPLPPVLMDVLDKGVSSASHGIHPTASMGIFGAFSIIPDCSLRASPPASVPSTQIPQPQEGSAALTSIFAGEHLPKSSTNPQSCAVLR